MELGTAYQVGRDAPNLSIANRPLANRDGIRLAASLTMMRQAAALVVLILTGIQPLTSASRQEMSEEVAALHRAVFEVQDDTTLGDPALWRELAVRYLEGRGVERDLIQGCALLSRADSAARSPRHDQVGIDIAQALLDQHCRSLSPDQAVEVGYVLGCGFIGLKKQILPLQPGSWVEFSRLGVAIDRPSGRIENRSATDLTCMRQVMLLRTVTLPGTNTQTDDTYLIEMLAWQGGWNKEKGFQRELRWSVFGVGKSDLEWRAGEILVSESGSLWPRPPVPERFRDGASFRFGPGGAIGWQFPGDRPLHGTVSR